MKFKKQVNCRLLVYCRLLTVGMTVFQSQSIKKTALPLQVTVTANKQNRSRPSLPSQPSTSPPQHL